jgi:dTDP-L-rhamnose 4-epimerase
MTIFFSNDIVLVTGGAGFIGSHLVPKLRLSGRRVRVLDPLSSQVHGAIPSGLEWLHEPGVEFMRGSVTNRGDLDRALADVNVVVHLAAETGTGQSMYEMGHYNQVNSQGTALLMEALTQRPKGSVRRVVLSSSRSIYGEGAYRCPDCGLSPVYPVGRVENDLARGRWDPACPRCTSVMIAILTTEDAPARPASIYAATKLAQEDLVRIATTTNGIDHAILRLQNVYGEGQSLKNPYTGILSIFSTRIRRGIVLPLFEDGEESRDFVHVDDVTDAMLRAVAAPALVGATMNVGSGRMTSVKEMAIALCRAFAVEPKVTITGEYRLGDIRHNGADVSRLRDHLGFVPSISLAEGLGRFATWALQDHLDRANAELRQRNLMK